MYSLRRGLSSFRVSPLRTPMRVAADASRVTAGSSLLVRGAEILQINKFAGLRRYWRGLPEIGLGEAVSVQHSNGTAAF